jgi:hypothetical protein
MQEIKCKPTLKLDWVGHDAAKYACENWHYSGCVPKSKLVKIGVWENEIFKGVIIYGVGATSDLVKRYGLKKNEGCELVRIALRDHFFPVSKMLAISIKMIKRNFKNIRLIVSFADPEQGHHGGIYQATNWIFSGYSQASDEYIYKGKRWQGRSFRNKYKGMEKHKDVKIVKGSSKIRYLMPLDNDIKKVCMNHSAGKYPKRHEHESNAPDHQSGEGGAVPTMSLHNSELNNDS